MSEEKSNVTTSHRIAVLPLANISPNLSDEYFADGMTEELISTLSKLSGLGVIARTSILRYKGLPKPIADIGKELNVATVLEGSVRIAGKKIRITAQLIDTATEEHIWSEVYDRELEDVFAIQSDIARRIAQSLKIKILKGEDTRIESKATEKPDAYKLYLKGRQLLNARTEQSLQQAVETFEQALEKDPDYELAYTGLADTHAVLALLEFVPPNKPSRERRPLQRKLLRSTRTWLRHIPLLVSSGFSTTGISLERRKNSGKQSTSVRIMHRLTSSTPTA